MSKTNNDGNFEEIEKFLHGQLSPEAELLFYQRLKTDEAFLRDFQLWTNLEDWLEEVTENEIKAAVNIQPMGSARHEGENKGIVLKMLTNKKQPVGVMLVLMVCFGGLMYWYVRFYKSDSELVTGQMSYVEGNTNTGKGAFEGDGSVEAKVPLNWRAEKYEGKDIMYQFFYPDSLSSPTEIIFRVPDLTKDFAKGAILFYSWSHKKFILKMDNQVFFINKTHDWEKLVPHKNEENLRPDSNNSDN